MSRQGPDLGDDETSTISFGALKSAARHDQRKATSCNNAELSRVEDVQTEIGQSLPRAAGPSRTSKNAPMEVSARKPVTRKKTVIAMPKPTIRDPRFDPAVGGVNRNKFKTDYAFLDQYEDSETAQLRKAMSATRDVGLRGELEKRLRKMESKKVSRDIKEREQQIVREHRRKERRNVEDGKKPYFLKNREIKDRSLFEKYKGSSAKSVDKAIAKQRRKQSAKAKKALPESKFAG